MTIKKLPKNENTKEAFYPILMKPVNGKNPLSKDAVCMEIFTSLNEEKIFVLKEIKAYFKNNPTATIGILVRNIKQVIEWTNYINNSGLKCITRSECLEQKAIFRVIFAVLNMVLCPFDNKVIANSYAVLAELGFYDPNYTELIRKSDIPFIGIKPDKADKLTQFVWDLNYWVNLPHISADELAIKIGLYYFS